VSTLGAPVAAESRAPADVLRPLVLALVWIEGVRLLRHPIFLGGVALSAAAMLRASNGDPGTSYWALVFFGLVPVGAATLFVTNFAALRSRRHHTDDLYASLPASARARTVSLLLAPLLTVPVSVALVALDYVLLDAGSGLELTWERTRGVPSLVELAQAPVAVLVLGVLGVALARLIPSTIVGPVAAVAVVATEYAVGGSNWPFPGTQARWALPFADPSVSPSGSFWPCYQDPGYMPCAVERFATGAASWHLLYLAAIGLLFAAVALVGHRHRGVPLVSVGAPR
jgi:hypothetical protein